MTEQRISYEEWIETYKPLNDHEGIPKIIETWEVAKYDKDKVWTLVDAEPYPVIVSGWHYVNRLHYHVTEVAIPANHMIEVEE